MTYFWPFLVKIRPIGEWQETKNFNFNYTYHISTKQAIVQSLIRVKWKESEKTPILGTPKKPEKGQEWIYPQATTNFYVKEYRDNYDIIRQKSSINPNFEHFEAQNDVFLTIFFYQNQANLRMTKIEKFELELYNHILSKEMNKQSCGVSRLPTVFLAKK